MCELVKEPTQPGAVINLHCWINGLVESAVVEKMAVEQRCGTVCGTKARRSRVRFLSLKDFKN
jgi:hypothetical protein